MDEQWSKCNNAWAMKLCGCIDSIDFFKYFGFVLVLCWHSIKKVAWEEKYDSTCNKTDIWYPCLRVAALAGEDSDFFAVQWQAASCERAYCVCWRGDMGAGASAGVGVCAGYTQQEGSPLWKSTPWTINECAWFDLCPMYGYFYMDSWKCRSVEQFLPCMWPAVTSRLIGKNPNKKSPWTCTNITTVGGNALTGPPAAAASKTSARLQLPR